MEEPIARCVPKTWYWFLGLLLYPVAGFLFTAILARPLLRLLGAGLSSPPAILAAWGAVTLAVAVWAYGRDIRRLCYTLLPDSLLLGRGDWATVIPFAEIESVVLGLPDKLPWWIRIQRFNPQGRAILRNAVLARSRTILLRLRGDRYLPLCLTSPFLEGGAELKAGLLRLNGHKVVGAETYTEREIDGLASARSNTLRTL